MLDLLPDAARVWLFPLDRTLADDAADALRQRLADWLPSWQSHGRPVHAEAAVVAGRALAVGAAISTADLNAGVSGCGIDSMERAVAAALEAEGVALAPALGVTYRDDAGAWASVSRPAFRRLVRRAAVDARTPVLDVTAETVGALRERGAERPAGEAWTGRAFRLAAPAA
jgi:hypothetical protein